MFSSLRFEEIICRFEYLFIILANNYTTFNYNHKQPVKEMISTNETIMDNYISVIAAIVAFVVTALVAIPFIPFLKKLKYGQTILEEGPKWHKDKS